MTIQDVIDQMIPLFREVLDADDIELTPETSARDIIEWDSLNHAQLFDRVVKHFEVDIPPAEAATFESVGDMARAILARRDAS